MSTEIHSEIQSNAVLNLCEINRNTTRLNSFCCIEGKLLLRVRDLEKTVLETFLKTCSPSKSDPACKMLMEVFPWC